jgi:hypothetical protein
VALQRVRYVMMMMIDGLADDEVARVEEEGSFVEN